MAKQRYIKDSMRSDNWFMWLDSVSKLIFTYLLTNDKVSICGVYELPLMKMMYETGIDQKILLESISKMEDEWKVILSKGWVGLPNFLKNQSMNGNMKTGAKREAEEVPHDIWLSFWQKKGFQRLSKAFESFDILNLTLLYSTLLNLTKPIGLEEEQSSIPENTNSIKPVETWNPPPPVPATPSLEREFVEKVREWCKKAWLIYKAWKYETGRARNILTWKDFGDFADSIGKTREETALLVLSESTKLKRRNGKINNCVTIYEHYAKIYNEAKASFEQSSVTFIT